MLNCPYCKSGIPLPDNEQPQAGTHAFTIVYDCGTEYDFGFGEAEGILSHKCTDGKKVSMEESIKLMVANRAKREFEKLTFNDSKKHYANNLFNILSLLVETLNNSGHDISASDLMVLTIEKSDEWIDPEILRDLIKKLHKEELV